MFSVAKKSNLLVLGGIRPDEFGLPAREALTPEPPAEARASYITMPKKFIGEASWVKHSNLKCWYCDQIPTSYPKFIPLYPEKADGGEDICDVYGHFCEWNCAAAYVIDIFPQAQQPDILHSIAYFESKFTGVRRLRIMPSPSKTKMAEYMGNGGITRAQWCDELAKLNANYVVRGHRLEDHKLHTY